MNHKWNNESAVIDELIRQKKAHLRKLSVALGIPLTTVRRITDKLLKDNVLDYHQDGKNKTMFLKNNLYSRLKMYAMEHAKALALLQNYPELSILGERILGTADASMIVLFGSYAKFAASKESDIDIYIETDSRETKKKVKALYSKLSVKIGQFDLRNNLVKEIIKDHVILRGVERFYEKLSQ